MKFMLNLVAHGSGEIDTTDFRTAIAQKIFNIIPSETQLKNQNLDVLDDELKFSAKILNFKLFLARCVDFIPRT